MMFWCRSAPLPVTEEERVERTEEFKQLLRADDKAFMALHKAGRNPDNLLFCTRWLESRLWDSNAAVQGAIEHAAWVEDNASIIPASDSHVPQALRENKEELFLQVRCFSSCSQLTSSSPRTWCNHMLSHVEPGFSHFYAAGIG
jgi:hypothetical protein